MAEWKGVPYFFDATGELQEQVSVVVGKIPQVVVETSFSWETVISAFFAALIPSFIAWHALKQNYKLAEYQNLLSSKKEISKELRVTIASYLSSIDIVFQLLTTFYEYLKNRDEKAMVKTANSLTEVSNQESVYYNKARLLLDCNNKNQKKILDKIESIHNSIPDVIKLYKQGSVDSQSKKEELLKKIDELISETHDVLSNNLYT
ncbi:hypothetical protein [Morganella morganii]|uniref:hypothetical protein n=1 Tax=Morganella morganii TaxID=582 RepID=UPI00091FAEC0|nr:hypothetical protein [Morganella morganii]MBT0338931.1 hypothetical protein [Morganella morganii subsp. morganii]SHM06766.1 hypothetical protein SAMN05216301_1732 [Morganella morganii]